MSDSDESVDEIAQLLEAELQQQPQTTTCHVKSKKDPSLSIQQQCANQSIQHRDFLQQQKLDCDRLTNESEECHVASRSAASVKFDIDVDNKRHVKCHVASQSAASVKFDIDVDNKRKLSASCSMAAVIEQRPDTASNCSDTNLSSDITSVTTNETTRSDRMESADCLWTTGELQLILSDVISQVNETETQQAQPQTLPPEIKTEFGRNTKMVEVITSPSEVVTSPSSKSELQLHLANAVVKEEQPEKTLNIQETQKLLPETVTRFSKQIKLEPSSSVSYSDQQTVVDALFDHIMVVEQVEPDLPKIVPQLMPSPDGVAAMLQSELAVGSTASDSTRQVQIDAVEDPTELNPCKAELADNALSQNEILQFTEGEIMGLPAEPAICRSEVTASISSQCQTLLQTARPAQPNSAAEVLDAVGFSATSVIALLKSDNGSANAIEEMGLAASALPEESVELELASKMLEKGLFEPCLPTDTVKNTSVPSALTLSVVAPSAVAPSAVTLSAVPKTESLLETESTENISSVSTNNDKFMPYFNRRRCLS
jgi:hypothetical protein